MIKNVGRKDKIVRLFIAILLISLFLTGVLSGTLGLIGLFVAGALVLTSLFSFCGLYKLFGINTCPVDALPESPKNKFN